MGESIGGPSQNGNGFLQRTVGISEFALAFVDPSDLHQCDGNASRLFLFAKARQGELVVRERFGKVLLKLVRLADSQQFLAAECVVRGYALRQT